GMRQLPGFSVSGPRSRTVTWAWPGVALLLVSHVPSDVFGATPLWSIVYVPCPVAPPYRPVLLAARTRYVPPTICENAQVVLSRCTGPFTGPVAFCTTRFPRVNVNVMVRCFPMGSFRVPVSANTPDALTVTLVTWMSVAEARMTSVPGPAGAGVLVMVPPLALPPPAALPVAPAVHAVSVPSAASRGSA